MLKSFALALAASAVGAAALAQAPALPPTSIKIIGPSLNSPPYEIVKEFWNGIPRLTGNRVAVEVQSLTELGLQGPEIVRMAKLGVTNIVISSAAFTSGDVPENDAMDFPGLSISLDTLKASVDAYEPTLAELYESRSGLKLLGLWPLAAQVFWCAVPVTGLQDLKGKKIRVAGAATAEFVEAAGAVPGALPFAEMIPALQRKVIDCAITGTVAGNLIKMYEVASHIYPLAVGWGLEVNVVNKRWWDGLPAETRAFIQAKMAEMNAIGWEQARIGTDHGIWCSTGDPRCDVSVTKPLPMNRASIALVPVSDADRALRLRLVEQSALPKFARRCGGPCTERWNQTVGKVFGVTAVAR